MFRRDSMLDYEKDLIKRQIKQLVQSLARLVAGARQEVKVDVALEQLRKTAGDLLKTDPGLLAVVDVSSVAMMLRDPGRIALYAHVVAEEAELHRRAGDPASAERCHRRAIALFEEAAGRAPLEEESQLTLEALRARPADEK
jgi:hypothetical protein